MTKGTINHYTDKEYRWTPSKYVLADFAYNSYKNQWVSMRVTLSGNNIYYFVNGDLAGSGSFTRPTADKFYIKSGGGIYLDELRVTTGAQPQLYADGNWANVTAMVYDGSSTKSALGFQFSPVGSAPDVDVDLEPGRPEKPGDKEPETCKHNWEETSRTEAACSHAGTVEYTCSKCGSTKTETLAKLKHVWELKQTTQTAYDEEGNVVTQGFTIYRCSLCG